MAKTIEALRKAEEERASLLSGSDNPLKIVDLKMTAQTENENHRLKYNLLRLTPEKKTRAILFSSCNEAEGTTTVLVNFAVTLASSGEKVLLVDANMKRPSLHNALKVNRVAGLTELLLGTRKIEEVVKQTEIYNLSLIPGGSPHPNSMTLFESDSLSALVARMKEMADWVLFDSSPVTRSMEPILLAPKVDGVVMVVEGEKTRWEVAESSRERLIGANGKVLGVVLNKRRYHVPEWLYKRL